MRFLLKVTLPVEAANKAVMEGTLGTTLQSIMAELKPEAAYFIEEEGERTAILIVDMKETSQIPSIAEPFFLRLNAKVRMHPVMTAEDLAKSGIESLGKKWSPK